MTNRMSALASALAVAAASLALTAPALAQIAPTGVPTFTPPAAATPPDRPAQAPATLERPRATTADVGDDYLLQPGDKLRIEVYKDAQLSQSVQVRPDGKITLPLIGDVAAMGLKPIALRERIATALRDYVNNPVVTVIVVEGTVPTAYIVGEVNHPGAVTLQTRMTVLQALAMAGGLKDFADAKNIRILRKGVTGTNAIPFNYKDAIKGSAAAAVYLEPGDTVVVPD